MAAEVAPIRVAVSNDYELIVRGVGALLAGDERIEVVELDVDAEIDSRVDVVLFDSFGTGLPLPDQIEQIRTSVGSASMVIFSDVYEADAVQEAFAAGVAAFVAKSVPAEVLVDAVVRVHAGDRLTVGVERLEEREPEDAGGVAAELPWPGKQFGLTEREANVLSLVVQGLDNERIGERLYISVNTVKTRLRGLYRKIDVDSRVKAALWGVKHGFDPDNLVLVEE